MAVHSSQALYAEALWLSERYGLSWYDALLVAAAIEGNSSLLYSEDLQHGQRIGDLQIQNLFL
jgi:predicted nucleic acid-binding protein